jgi:hypothetical protein
LPLCHFRVADFTHFSILLPLCHFPRVARLARDLEDGPAVSNSTGYKHPPTHTRFRPGRSGNPGGRPKRRPSFRATLLAELAETMPGNDRQGAQTKLRALIKTLVNAAIAGDARAQALLVSALARIGDVEDNEPDELTSDDREILESYVGGELKRRANDTGAAPSAGEDNAE